MTQRQSDILKYIGIYIRRRGEPPTRREIAEFFNMKQNTVSHIVWQLEAAGYVAVDRQRIRNVTVLREAS